MRLRLKRYLIFRLVATLTCSEKHPDFGWGLAKWLIYSRSAILLKSASKKVKKVAREKVTRPVAPFRF